jgi:hypothetical protein
MTTLILHDSKQIIQFPTYNGESVPEWALRLLVLFDTSPSLKKMELRSLNVTVVVVRDERCPLFVLTDGNFTQGCVCYKKYDVYKWWLMSPPASGGSKEGGEEDDVIMEEILEEMEQEGEDSSDDEYLSEEYSDYE